MPVQTQLLGLDGITPVSPTGPLPAAAVTAQKGSGSVAAAAATATIAAVAGKTNYLTGFLISGVGATAAGISTLTITGLLGGTITIPVAIPVTPAAVFVPWSFASPMAASAVNTAISASVTSFGAGSTDASVTVTGYTV